MGPLPFWCEKRFARRCRDYIRPLKNCPCSQRAVGPCGSRKFARQRQIRVSALAVSLHFSKDMAHAGFYSMESLSGIYALVVESENERRALVSGILRYCGALVTPTATPEAALAIMALFRPDVVIVDVSNADDAGLAFIRSVRALKPEDGGMVPAIAVGDDNSNAELARSRGFDAYVSAPLEAWELCRIVARLVTG